MTALDRLLAECDTFDTENTIRDARSRKLARIVRKLHGVIALRCECVRRGAAPCTLFDCDKFPCLMGRELAEAEKIAGEP